MDKKYRAGDKIKGFTVTEVKELPDYSSVGYFLRHEESGFEVYHMSNDDKECFFNYTIYTPPVNDTGVFHILEHTLLTGSRKYPVRDPFMMMVRNSCNTFLNAMTGPDRTYYPAASPVKKDFDNIFQVYTDAVFDPLLRKESFQQEGIRLSTGEEGLHFEGVVFSEMQGDISQHESVVAAAASRPLFDSDSPYRYEYGGDPASICDLTYEEFIATYKKHYAPANMTLFFYGNLDLEEKLIYLEDEYLSRKEAGEKINRASYTDKWSTPQRTRATSNSDDDNDSSTVMVSWLLSGSEDPRLNTEVSLLVDILLGNPGSPLYRAIVESGLGRDLSTESGMSDAYRQLLFAVGISGADEENSDKIEAFILSALKDIAEKGLPSKTIEASIRRMEFRLQEIPGGMPQGYSIFFSRVDKGWTFGKSPSEMLSPRSVIEAIRLSWKEDPKYFEHLIEKLFINNPHRLLSVTVMDKDTQGRLDQEIQSKLEFHRAEYSQDEEKAYEEFEASEDSDEAIDKLPRLDLDDIPDESLDINHKIDGNIISSCFPTGGVIYADMAFDVSDLSYEELEDLSLLSRLLLMTNVEDMNYSEFLTELRFCTGASAFIVESGTDYEGNEKIFLYGRFKALSDYYDDALNLFEKLFKHHDCTSIDRIKAALTDIETDFQTYSVRSAHQFALGAASQNLNPALYTIERILGISFWYRVTEMLEDLEAIPQRLKKLGKKVFTSERLIFHLSCEDRDFERADALTKAFINSLEKGEKPGVSKRNPDLEPKKLAYTFSSPVSYVSLACKAEDKNNPDSEAERMFLSMVSRNELWSLIREKGGAYGAGAMTDATEGIISFYTYRDPRVDESIEDFTNAILNEEITDNKIEDGRLNVLSRDVKPMGPSAMAMIDLRRYLYKVTDEIRHQQKAKLLAVSGEDMERVREKLASRLKGDVGIAILTDSRLAEESSMNLDIKALPIR